MTGMQQPRRGCLAATQRVSVIVVNYNAGDLLRGCVSSVLPCVSQVVVVDNASSDHSVRALQGLPGAERLHIIHAGRNLGFAAACNLGIAAAQGDRLLFLNPDCLVEPTTVSRLLEVLESSSTYGMAGGLLLNPDHTEQRGGRRKLPTPWSALLRFSGLTFLARRWPRWFPVFDLNESPLPPAPEPVEAISGACMLVKSQALQAVGGWDEGYFLHCEDLDWCKRFSLGGWRIVFVPDARVVHAQGACSRSRPMFVEWHKHKGMLRYYRKFTHGWRYWLLVGPVVVGVFAHFAGLALRHLIVSAVQKKPNQS